MGGIVIDKLFEKLSGFGEREHWLLLRQLLKTAIHDSTNGEHEDRVFGQRLYKLMEIHIDAVNNQRLQQEKRQTHVHVVFSLSEAGSLKVALSKVGKREESRVVAFNDWFSVGPITELSTDEGQLRRRMWLMEHDRDSYYSDIINQEHQIEHMIDTLKNIPENKTVVIWCGDNAHDQTGLRFAMYLLRERKSPVHVVNVTQILTETGQANAPIAQALVERDKYIDPGALVNAGEVVTNLMEVSQQRISYPFIMYRIWCLVSDGVLTFKGQPGFPHQFLLGLSRV